MTLDKAIEIKVKPLFYPFDSERGSTPLGRMLVESTYLLKGVRRSRHARSGANSHAGAPVSRDIVDLFFSFFFLLLLSNNKSIQRCYHAALVRPHFHILLVIPLCLQLFLFHRHRRQPRGGP